MPERLEGEQRLFFEVLNEVWEENRQAWEKNTRRIVWTVALAAALGIGVTVGVIQAAQHRIVKTTRIIGNLHTQVEMNQRMVRDMEDERRLSRERYEALMAAFGMLRERLERQREQADITEQRMGESERRERQ